MRLSGGHILFRIIEWSMNLRSRLTGIATGEHCANRVLFKQLLQAGAIGVMTHAVRKVPVKKNVRFPRSGEYRFEFEQGMRIDPLPLVMDFGFEIEKVN